MKMIDCEAPNKMCGNQIVVPTATAVSSMKFMR